MVPTFEVPTDSVVLAHLRLEVGVLLEEITVYTSAQDLHRMQKVLIVQLHQVFHHMQKEWEQRHKEFPVMQKVI